MPFRMPAGHRIPSDSKAKRMRRFIKLLKIVWASPYSLLGIIIGLIGVATGGSMRLRDGAIEFFGGATKHLSDACPRASSRLALHWAMSFWAKTMMVCDTQELTSVFT